MRKIRVGLFFGGVDQERDISISSAEHVRKNLDAEKYDVSNIEITPTEQFLVDGIEMSISDVCKKMDIALLALHGLFGEDGTLQRMLDEHSVPHTGSDALASAVSFSKALSKDVFDRFSIQTPSYEIILSSDCSTKASRTKVAKELFTSFPQPCVIKPSAAGSSLGISVAQTTTEITDGLGQAALFGEKIVVEEYISGCEVTVGVIDNFRDEDTYALPAVEITLPDGKMLYDFDSKYGQDTQEICPAVLQEKTRDTLSEIAMKVHTTLHLKDYSRTDFIIHPKRGVFALEVNALPGLGKDMLFSKELEAVGITMSDFLDHIITQNIR